MTGAGRDAQARRDEDVHQSELLVAAATSLAAGIYLVAWDAAGVDAWLAVTGSALILASFVSVATRVRWLGMLMVALAVVAAGLVAVDDAASWRPLLACAMAATAGVAISWLHRT